MDKKKYFRAIAAVLAVLVCLVALLVLFALSPVHPKNLTVSDITEKGTEYTVRLSGIYGYGEHSFELAARGFYFSDNKAYVYTDEEGYACTSYDRVSEAYVLGKYNSSEIFYEDYSFTGESYKNQTELEAFFEKRDPIYNFDINELPYYVSDVITYKKKFWGKAKVKLYRGRCVITEIYIGDEKVLELKK